MNMIQKSLLCLFMIRWRGSFHYRSLPDHGKRVPAMSESAPHKQGGTKWSGADDASRCCSGALLCISSGSQIGDLGRHLIVRHGIAPRNYASAARAT
jgi:hypothetical protein